MHDQTVCEWRVFYFFLYNMNISCWLALASVSSAALNGKQTALCPSSCSWSLGKAFSVLLLRFPPLGLRTSLSVSNVLSVVIRKGVGPGCVCFFLSSWCHAVNHPVSMCLRLPSPAMPSSGYGTGVILVTRNKLNVKYPHLFYRINSENHLVLVGNLASKAIPCCLSVVLVPFLVPMSVI